ncbi:MAG: hypothetical protein WDZ41_04340 [Candidatus Babeliales bacterium]
MMKKYPYNKIFNPWQYEEKPFTEFSFTKNNKNHNAELFFINLKNRLKNYPASLRQIKHLCCGYKKEKFLIEQLEIIHGIACNHEIATLCDYFIKCYGTSYTLNQEEKHASIDKVMAKYNSILRLCSLSSKRNEQNQFLYTLANDFFFFCFDPNTFYDFMQLTDKSNYHPLIRMIYSIIWIHLGSKGWCTWHHHTIENLKKESLQGKEIVYIAGGTDIYQLLKNGIYTIRVIDPFLPTQNTYYSNGWRTLVGGRDIDQIGDEIHIPFDDTTIILKRIDYKQHGPFFAQLSNGKKRRLPESTTLWHVYKKDTQKKCGVITINRRFTQQNDFSYSPKKTLLLSYNELYFIATSGEQSWGIDVHKLDPQLNIYIKQLRNPISKKILKNISYTDQIDFSFIQLGNCIN